MEEEEEEQSDENHPTHFELNQEKTRLKTQRPNFKGIVLKGDFFPQWILMKIS